MLFDKHIYQRVLGVSKTGVLKSFDVETRKFLRRVLHQPKDTPLSFFHSEVTVGGLDVPTFLRQVEVLRQVFREWLVDSHDHQVAAATRLLLLEPPLSAKDYAKSIKRQWQEE